MLCVFMSSHGQETFDAGLATYLTPEPAVAALAHAVRYATWRARPAERPVSFDDVRRDEAALVIADAIQRGDEWLAPADVERLLECYGIVQVEQQFVATPEEAATAAVALGGSVALKVIAPGLVHKSEHGGVRLALGGASAVRRAASRMSERVRHATGKHPAGFVVQRMLKAGVEMLVGVVSDRQFGPTVACGAGGVHAEVLKDVAVRLAPLTASDARTMLRELRTFPLLDGYRGSAHLGVSALEEVVLRVSTLAEHHPQIAELECNPVIVTECGAIVVDARARVQDIDPPRPLGARR
jgi:acyl-CoA synthetase (NDP forming)